MTPEEAFELVAQIEKAALEEARTKIEAIRELCESSITEIFQQLPATLGPISTVKGILVAMHKNTQEWTQISTDMLSELDQILALYSPAPVEEDKPE